MTVDGEPLWNTYDLWRITHEADSVHAWGFKDRRILKQLPESEVVPVIPQGRNITIANCTTSQLQQFLAEQGGKMTRNSENFLRYDQAATD